MIKTNLFTATALASLLLALSPAEAAGGAARAWVSGHGTDAAGCGSPTSPCRTFQYVHDNIIAAGGEIDVLDPAGYGAVTITKAVSIVNDGVGVAGVQQTASGQNAITINLATVSNVTLRGLTIEGGGTGADGISVISNLPNQGGVAVINILNCLIKDFAGAGVSIAPTLAGVGAVPTQNVVIADSSILDNASSGVAIAALELNVNPEIYRTRVTGNANGVNFSGGCCLAPLIVGAVISQNQGVGISNSSGYLTLKASTVMRNGSTDIVNGLEIWLFDHNTIGGVQNNTSFGYTDGSNNIFTVGGNALTQLNPQ